MNALGAAALGLALGIVTGMPLAVINVAIVEAATSGRRQFAIGLGLGGAVADAAHAALAFGGIGQLVMVQPWWVRIMTLVAAIIITAYVVVVWRARRRHAAANDVTDRGIARGALTGVALTLPNPAALGAWVAVATAVWPGATTSTAAIVATGVGVGSATWFSIFARWIAAARQDHPARKLIPRIAIGLLLATVVLGAVRLFD